MAEVVATCSKPAVVEQGQPALSPWESGEDRGLNALRAVNPLVRTGEIDTLRAETNRRLGGNWAMQGRWMHRDAGGRRPMVGDQSGRVIRETLQLSLLAIASRWPRAISS